MPGFLFNSWYVAAWDREVGRAPVARTMLGEPVVLYRREDGTVVALEDRCCHRDLPLSMGAVEGDRLRCGYQGLLFDDSGACVEVPGQANVPARAKIRAYPVIERYRWVWVWMGDPQKADPALIPDFWWCDHPDWAWTRPDPIVVDCHYQLINDNVLDVTHLAYVHATSIGSGAITEFPVTCEREGRVVRMKRWIIDRPEPPLYQKAGGFAGNVDRWQIVEHVPPCFSVNFAGCADTGTGAPEGDRRGRRIDLMAVSAPTPESESRTRYYFGFLRSFALDDAETEKLFSVGMVKVFHEDVAVLEAQQRMNTLMPDAPTVSLNVDAAPMAARRLLAQWIRAESVA